MNTAQDRNTQTTTYTYGDSLNRLTSISYPDTGLTSYGYGNSGICAQPSSISILLYGSTYYTETATVDGLCRVTNTTVTSDPVGDDYTDTTYDGMGKVWTVSNTYRSKSDPTYGVTTYSYDILGRLSDEGSTKSVVYPDLNNTSTTYSTTSSTDCSTVIDPGGIQRLLCSDGLGRLTSVNEAGTYTTSYTYNAVDDLLTVTQGSQTRTFNYDLLSRVTSASNPESATTHYCYTTTSPCVTPDPGTAICSGDPGSTCTRSDARGITTTYAYVDTLNRLTGKSYSDGTTPPVSFSYDQTSVSIGTWSSGTLANYKGRLTEGITTSSGSTQTGVVYSYDPMGRPATYWQCTPSTCVNPNFPTLVYNYDAAGDIASWVHPAGFTITNTISGARLVTQVSSSLNSSTQPPVLAQSITYTPWGALTSRTNGCVGTGCTNVVETYDYNNRMQPVRLQLGNSGNLYAEYCLVYNYYTSLVNSPPSSCAVPSQGTGNNGDVINLYDLDGQNNSTMTHTETYTYDNVNRLATAFATENATYNLTFSYTQDGSTGQYGNMSCLTNGQTQGLCPNYTFNPATNQINTAGFSYDQAGNLLSDGTHSYTWDAEGRLLTMDGGTTASIVYNALGQMVQNLGNNTTYNAEGERTSGGGYEIVPWGNVPLVKYGTATLFVHGNVLGSSTDVTDQTGAERQDQIFYPWGQTWVLHQLPDDSAFAAMEPLTTTTGEETDIAQHRHYSESYGRWLSPDPLGQDAADPTDPQTWNMYAYAGNNPTTNVDPDGTDYYLLGRENCNQNGITCDQQGYVLDQSGNRQVITDQQVLNGSVGIGSGLNGTTWLSTSQGTFEGQFFDNTPTSIDVNGTPGSAAAAVGTNLGIGMWNQIADFGNSFMTNLTVGQYSLNLPNVPGGLGNAAFSGQALAMLLPAIAGDDEPTPGQVAQAEQVLLKGGRGSVAKAIRRFEQLLAEHESDLVAYRAAGGYTSKTESEIRNFKQLIQAYRQVLGR